jgi:hypothetical protein
VDFGRLVVMVDFQASLRIATCLARSGPRVGEREDSPRPLIELHTRLTAGVVALSAFPTSCVEAVISWQRLLALPALLHPFLSPPAGSRHRRPRAPAALCRARRGCGAARPSKKREGSLEPGRPQSDAGHRSADSNICARLVRHRIRSFRLAVYSALAKAATVWDPRRHKCSLAFVRDANRLNSVSKGCCRRSRPGEARSTYSSRQRS